MRPILFGLSLILAATFATAQNMDVPFGGLEHDSSLPVEISADSLSIDQEDGSVTFTGNVVVGQGEMRLSADHMRVEYSTGEDSSGEIHTIFADGNVLLVNGAEAAEAGRAEYLVAEGIVELSGGVILTQGRNGLSAEELTINLNTGTAQMSGRVSTILQTEAN